jgi:hypothetical protein
VIDDEQWWGRFGGQLQANWEVERIRLYSSRETVSLRDLMRDPQWSNEGLFAFSEGLRRLAELDTTQRVAAPFIDVEASDGREVACGQRQHRRGAHERLTARSLQGLTIPGRRKRTPS